MNKSKDTIVILVVGMLAMFAWMFIATNFFGPKQQPPQQNNQQVQQQQAVSQPSAAPERAVPQAEKSKPATPETKSAAPEAKPVPVQADKPGVNVPEKFRNIPPKFLENYFIRVAIDPGQGAIIGVELKKFQDAARKDNIVLDKEIQPLPGALAVNGEKPWILTGVKIENPAVNTIRVTREFNAGEAKFSLVQTWMLEKKYSLKYSLEFVNPAKAELKFSKIFVSVGVMRPLTYLSGDVTRRENHSVDYLRVKDKYEGSVYTSIKETDNEFGAKSELNPISWVGLSNKYFTCVLLPEKQPFDGGNAVRRSIQEATNAKGKVEKYVILGADGCFKDIAVPASGTKTIELQYYAGPKTIKNLKEFSPSTTPIMHLFYRWPYPILEVIAKGLEWISQGLLAVLVFLKGIFGSYGWSIIVLTIIVKAIFWPITQRATASMKKMQKLQPLVAEIRKKYKDNPQEMNAKVMALYKEHKVNPLGGCFPILLQLPVFLALYSTLEGAVQLRHTSFLWIHDLCLPDTVGHIFGLPIHPLIIAMTLLMFFQQKLTPAAADPTQQKMMMIMPLVLLFFLYNLPAGLTLYWTVSQAISILQLVVNQKMSKDDDKLVTAK